MKNLLLILFISISSICSSQTLVTTLDHDTCLDKKFSIVFYIVLDSTYSVGSATQPTLDMVIDTLNSRFNRICVSFANCSTVFIPNYPYREWLKSITDPVVTANWYTDKTINFFIVDSVKPEPINQEWGGGYAYGPPLTPADIPKDVIVIEQQRLIAPYFQAVFHHMGHFFGLVHTEDEIGTGPNANPMPVAPVTSQEYADESNCEIHGDCLCDTEADPGPIAQITDGKGQRYVRPLDNYMSRYGYACRYTQQQYNKMARIIFTRRLYLH